MHLKTRTWILISLLCFIGAGYFWHLGNQQYWRDMAPATNSPAETPIKELGAYNFRHAPPPIYSSNPSNTNDTNLQLTAKSQVWTNALLTNRLSNTLKPLSQLLRNDHAILLRNALIDTSVTDPLNIPARLRSQGPPGSYVVQSQGLLNENFRAKLRAAGATIVSYIPNNAYLVRASESAANLMRSLPQTQSVLPWEPYYKLDLNLLALAVQNQPMPGDTKLNVVLFPGELEAGRKAFEAMGAAILGEDRSPFGHKLVVALGPNPSNVLPDLARLPLVQTIEFHHPRQLVNDLTRPRVGVSSNSFSPPPDYLGLTGDSVSVNVNDTGIDVGHPDFDSTTASGSRVQGDDMAATSDYDGHGTHVAGIIAGNGSKSDTVTKRPPGSATNGPPWNFRGMAPSAKLYVSRIDLLTGPLISDGYLQETAAKHTNFISNNSWGYVDSLDYDSSAASYDAAVRDAIPGQPGPEPMLFVFAAGNSGAGDNAGKSGESETISSPATSKNGITVGAIEKARGITNLVVSDDGKRSNAVFLPQTDSDNQVAYFSSRGNVGVGIEGEFGRFKPDIMAPGVFTISCRAENWTDPTASGGVILNRIKGEFVKPGKTNAYDIFIPGNGVSLDIITRSNSLSPNPFPNLPIYLKSGAPPDLNNDLVGVRSVFQPVTPGQWFFAIGNNSQTTVNYDLITVIHLRNTNSGTYFQVLSNLNYDLGPPGDRHWYRYESGTSQAAPVVSGTLALIQEFFEKQLKMTKSENWPALMKAMIINGSRSMSSYDRQVNTALNLQGWGVLNLTNSLPAVMATNANNPASWPIAFFYTTNLYTGQSHTRKLTVNNFARAYPLRFTLVWTDPPGNPAAGVKLVNDLDLIVSNNIPDGEVYYGNNIGQGTDFNTITDPSNTNTPPVSDLVNNVENVFINRPIPGTNYTITVKAHRVNVNAVTGQTNGILQDYALVISSGNPLLTSPFTIQDVSPGTQLPDDNAPFVKSLTNGVPRLHERVGANNPDIEVLNNGITNQWNFYIYTNNTAFTNVVFGTFLAPNLARSRFPDAGGDIDLYVSPSSDLTNLLPSVVADCIAGGPGGGRVSRGRGGTETVVYTNPPNKVFYVAVKSEDQQAVEFELLGLALNDSGRDGNGNVRLVFQTTPAEIPDGAPEKPEAAELFAFVFDPAKVRRIIVTNSITHENAGDLFGIMTHPGGVPASSVVLNNHRSFSGNGFFIYDDSRQGDILNSQPTDGPGSLRSFVGEMSAGFWRFTMIDNAQYHTGRVDFLVGYIEPDDSTNLMTHFTVCGNQWFDDFRDVPLGVTNMVITLTNMSPPLPLDVYIRLGDLPTLVDYDKKMRITAPGGSFSFSINDSPGLQPGNRYYISLYNPAQSTCVSGDLGIQFQYGLAPIASQTILSGDTPKALADDAVTNSYIIVTNNRAVADLKVGIRVDHPRISDLVFHLISPQGTRIMLSENRGGLTATNFGYGQPTNFIIPFLSIGDYNEFRTNIDTGERSGVVRVDYDFFGLPDSLRIYYDGNRIFDSGYISGAGTFSIVYGPGFSKAITVVVNEGGNPQPFTLWQMTVNVTGPWNYATFTDNPNLGGPVKFGLPPYHILPFTRIVLSNSFEGVNVLTNMTNFNQYDINPMFENWTVRTNGVAVFTDTNHPYALGFLGSTNWGTNFLALSSGEVSLPLTNIVFPDHEYILSLAHRKVSSSPTQAVVLQVPIDANIYSELHVTNGPAGPNSGPYKVPEVRLCAGQQIFISAGSEAIGDTNALPYQGLTKYGLIGAFGFSPDMLTSNTIAGQPFYIGTNSTFIDGTNYIVITAPNDAGDYYLYLGINNDNFNNQPPFFANNPNAPPFYSVTSYWQQCQYASAEVRLGANTIPITGSANWKVESQPFLANPTMTNLVLHTNINTTMLFDAIQIEELVSTMYYQSEEPMTPFKGQLALGAWRLEVWDNRSGPVNFSTGSSGNGTNDTGTLFSWALNFVFADAPAAIPLTNDVVCSNTVRGSQIKYFVVAVPNEVIRADNYLSSSGPGSMGVELLYSPLGLPIGQSPPDPVFPIPEGATPLTLTPLVPQGAELPRGRLYYLGVRNRDATEVNDFTIRAAFNIRPRPLPNTPVGDPPSYQNQTLRPNPYSWTEIRANPSLAVTNMDYYYFDVGSTDIVSATVSVYPLALDPQFNGDVNLVLRRALPVVDLFPRPTFFDYESTQPNFGNEIIIINSNSLPVKLEPGRWYVGVYNTTNAVAHYDIVSHRDVVPLWNYVDLINGVPAKFSFSSYDDRTNFFRFVVDGTNSKVLFEIYGDAAVPMTVNADLLARPSDLPSGDLYDFSLLQKDINFTNFTYQPEMIALETNIFIPSLNATNWFLQVVTPNPLAGGFSGYICAKTSDITGMLADCASSGGPIVTPIALPGAFAFFWNSIPGEKYEVLETANLSTWTLAKTIKATNTKTSFSTPAPKTGPPRFYQVRQVP